MAAMGARPPEPSAHSGPSADRPPAGFELTEHTADVGIHAWGPTEATVFEQAALALFSLLCDPATVEPREAVGLEAEAPMHDLLLVAWLNELLYRFEADGLVFHSFAIDVLGARTLSGTAFGEPLDLARHAAHAGVKAVTYHGLALRRTGKAWEATVVLDV
jgi:protein archease